MPEKSFTLSAHDGSFFKTPNAIGVRFERILDHPVSAVWTALTDPGQLAKWLAPTTIEGEQGGKITLHLTGGVMGGKIMQWKKNALLEYVWYNGSTVRWELLSEGKDRTRLVFTHSHVQEFQLIDAAKGWHYHLDLLALSLDGIRGPAHPVEIWDEITREANIRYKESIKTIDEPQPPAFVIERVYNAPVGRIWQALTNKEELKHWSFEVDDFEPEEGFEFTFSGEKDGERFIHFCRVNEIINERKLSYSWRYENINGISHVIWELFPEGKKTRLRLTHQGLENFAHAGAPWARRNFMAGWGYYFDKALPAWLEKTPVGMAH